MKEMYNPQWYRENKERLNTLRRNRRARAQKQRLQGKRCLNCEVLLAERLDYAKGRSYLYCRKCITEYKDEARRHRWRRYYVNRLRINKRKKVKPVTAPPVKATKKQSTHKSPYIVSWRTLKSL